MPRSGFEVPGHESIDLRDRLALRDPFESLREPGMRIDVIHFRGLQQCGDGRPGPAAAMAAREERIFSCDGSLDDVGVDLDAAVAQEALES